MKLNLKLYLISFTAILAIIASLFAYYQYNNKIEARKSAETSTYAYTQAIISLAQNSISPRKKVTFSDLLKALTAAELPQDIKSEIKNNAIILSPNTYPDETITIKYNPTDQSGISLTLNNFYLSIEKFNPKKFQI